MLLKVKFKVQSNSSRQIGWVVPLQEATASHLTGGVQESFPVLAGFQTANDKS